MNDYWKPKIVGFLCNWCAYAGADLAGVSRLQYPPNLCVIRVMCSSRISPLLVLRAFQQGADGVLVAGCHPGDCHYQEGNLYVRRRFALLRTLFEYVGVEPVRFQVRWVSASEGTKFAEIVHEFTAVLERLGRQTKLARQQLRGW